MADDDKWQLVLQAIKQTGDANASALNVMAGAMGDLTQEIRATNLATVAHGSSSNNTGDRRFGKNGSSDIKMFAMFLVIITGVAGVGMALLSGEQRVSDVRAEFILGKIDNASAINNKLDTRLTTVEKYQTAHEAEVSRFNATQFADIGWLKQEIAKLWYRGLR